MQLIALSIWLIIPVLMLLLVKSHHWTKLYYNQPYVYPVFLVFGLLGYLLLPECLCANPKDFITGTVLWVLAVFIIIFITWMVAVFLRRKSGNT